MKTLKLSKQFGIHPEGSEIEVNEILEKHLISGGFVTDEPVKVKKTKK